MERSNELDQLAAALSAAQAEIEGADKAKVNPAFRSKYADLASVWDACKDALTKHGLAVSQVCEPSEPGTLQLTTMLLHRSGQWLSGTCAMPLMKVDPQGYGSAMTYARRYCLAALVGVCPEDDDGNAASGRGNGHQEPQPSASRPESNGDRRSPWGVRPEAPAERGPESLACTTPDCGKPLTKGQHDVSVRAYGKPLCPGCQKANTPLPSANGNAYSRGA